MIGKDRGICCLLTLLFWLLQILTRVLPILAIILIFNFFVNFSSPHLVQVRERIRINGQPISKELFTKYFWQVYGRLDETKVGVALGELFSYSRQSHNLLAADMKQSLRTLEF